MSERLTALGFSDCFEIRNHDVMIPANSWIFDSGGEPLLVCAAT